MKKSYNAFTLVELLTVIAISGILIAILLPVVGSVRATAHGTACLSNLRELAVAGKLYVQDHKGKFPSTTLYNSMLSSKPGIQEYVGGSKLSQVYRCPVLKDYPFAKEHLIEGTDVSGCTYSASLTTSNNENGGAYALVYMNRVGSPARTAWIMDGVWMDSYFATVIGRNQLSTQLDRLQYPHKGRQAVVFVDGHAESLDRSEIPTDPEAVFWTGL